MFAPRLAGIAWLLPLTSCYFWYPHEIKRQLAPPHVAGGQIELVDEKGVDYYTCREHSTTCVVHDGELKEENPYIATTAKYNGKELTRGEVAELVEPDLQTTRWAAMLATEHTCSYAKVPSYAFAVGALADMVGGAAVSQTKNDIPLYLFVGGAALMLAGAAISYPMGGYACTHAKRIAERNGIISDLTTTWVTHPDEPGEVAHDQELRRQVAAFNAAAGGASPVDDAPTDEAPPSAEP